MKIYLASMYGRRAELEEYAKLLKGLGYEITSEWVYGKEDGMTYEDIALMDLEHVDAADCILSFTEPYGTFFSSGGRHVELGYGLALGKGICIVGERENVFHHHPTVCQHNRLIDFIAKHPPHGSTTFRYGEDEVRPFTSGWTGATSYGLHQRSNEV